MPRNGRTTHLEFITALAALPVAGVKRNYTIGATPPTVLETSELPALWVWNSSIQPTVLSYGNQSMFWPVHLAEVVIAVQRIGADIGPGPIYESCAELAENLEAALELAHQQGTVANEGIDWTIQPLVPRQVGPQAASTGLFWCVVANVSTHRAE